MSYRLSQLFEIGDHNFTSSKIIKCTINENNYNKLKYKSILVHIYKLINDGASIIRNTEISIVTIEKKDKGYKYIPSLGISVQGVDANKCLKEILNQCEKNNIKIQIKIELKNDKILSITC